MLTWHCKHFDQLSTYELYAIMQVRQDVFVIEQNCIYSDLDKLDFKCQHLFATYNTSKQNQEEEGTSDISNIVAYLRILPPNLSYPEASFGRVLTTAKARGTGAGKELVNRSIQVIQKEFPNQRIKIAAQLYLQNFYSGFGFNKISDTYDEDGIDHIDMLLKPH